MAAHPRKSKTLSVLVGSAPANNIAAESNKLPAGTLLMNGWLFQLRWYLQSAQDCVTHKNVPIVWVLLLVCRLHKGQVEKKDSRHDSKAMYLFS